MAFCGKCGHELQNQENFCPKCGNPVKDQTGQEQKIDPSIETAKDNSQSQYNQSTQDSIPIREFGSLSPYYQEEFARIQNSSESYKGKWNWAAFFFGIFWALSKGLWLSVIVAFVLSLFTSGIAGIVYWFIYGFRGNYMYYKLYTDKKQLFL